LLAATRGYFKEMDAITLLKDDHRTVEALFKKFERAGDRAFVQKRSLVDKMIEELSQHAAIEELLFYPVTRATVTHIDDVVLESIEEHHVVKWILSELEKMDPRHERFDAKVTVLIESVRHHVKEEEADYFPKVRDELSRSALADLGAAMSEAKAAAPTRPHPRLPQTPPGNALAVAAGAADRVGDTVSGLASGGLSAVQDLVDRIRGTSSNRTAVRGSSDRRRTATRVRSRSDRIVDKTVATVREAKTVGRKTVGPKTGATRASRARTAPATKKASGRANAARTRAKARA
jgi:hemerythrin superfamily protein